MWNGLIRGAFLGDLGCGVREKKAWRRTKNRNRQRERNKQGILGIELRQDNNSRGLTSGEIGLAR